MQHGQPAGLKENTLAAENSLAEPHRIKPTETTQPYARDMAFDLAPYTVAVVEIRAE